MTATANSRTQRLTWAAIAGVTQRLAQMAGTLVTMPLVLGALGDTGFGLWGAAASIAWLAGLADFGIGSAVLGLIAHAVGTDSRDDARQAIATALSLACGVAIALGAVGATAVVLAVPAPLPWLVAVLGLAVNVPLSLGNQLWMGVQRGWVAAWWELAQTVLTVGMLFVASQSTSSVLPYVVAVYAGLVLANLGSLVHFLLAHPALRPHRLASAAAAALVLGRGLRFFALGFAGSAAFLFDNLIALALLGSAAAASLTVVMRLSLTALGLLQVISQPLWPAFTEAAARGDERWLVLGLLRGTALVTGVAIVGAVLLIGLGQPVLQLWLGRDVGIGPDLLGALAAWVVALGVIRVPGLFLNALSVLGFQVVVLALATLAGFTLKLALAPVLGTAALLWGTTLSTLAVVLPVFAWHIARLLTSRRGTAG